MVDKSKDLMLTLGPVAQEGIARGSNGKSLIRLSSVMTVRNPATGAIWKTDVETFVVADPSGDLETGQFSKEDGLARLAHGGAAVDSVAFGVSFALGQPAGDFEADIIASNEVASLFSGTKTIELSSGLGSKAQAVGFTVFGIRPAAGSTLTFLEDEERAQATFNSMHVEGPKQGRRRRPS